MAFLQEDIFKLVLSLLTGAIIGAEREYRSKSAGFRTTIMICMGSTLFTLISQRLGEDSDDRVAANIVNGIGFLGAGIIFKEDNNVRGLTTAATIWAVSALGMCIGGGEYGITFIGFILIMASLLLLGSLSSKINELNQTREYKIVTQYRNKTLSNYEKLFIECGLSPQRGQQQRIGNEITGQWRVYGPEKAHEKCIRKILSDNDIKGFVF